MIIPLLQDTGPTEKGTVPSLTHWHRGVDGGGDNRDMTAEQNQTIRALTVLAEDRTDDKGSTWVNTTGKQKGERKEV